MTDTPDLRAYDWILVNSSAGKDSQAMLDHIVREAKRLEVPLSRVVVVHCDLTGMEWAGTKELAEEQARFYGVRFEVVKRDDTILAYVERRHATLTAQGKKAAPWPSPQQRWCTSDFKRAPVRKLMTQLVRESGYKTAPVRILNCMGLRAEESSQRAKKVPFERDASASNGKRTVDTWLPVHAWKVEEVWATIKASGCPHHKAYDLGMQRLSCAICIFAPKAALVLAGHHNRALLAQYVEVEKRVGYTFKRDESLADVQAEVERTTVEEARARATKTDAGCWNM